MGDDETLALAQPPVNEQPKVLHIIIGFPKVRQDFILRLTEQEMQQVVRETDGPRDAMA